MVFGRPRRWKKAFVWFDDGLWQAEINGAVLYGDSKVTPRGRRMRYTPKALES